MNSAHFSTPRQHTNDKQPTFVIETCSQSHLIITTDPTTIWHQKVQTINHSINNGSGNLKVSFLCFELKHFILALSIKVLKGYILALLLNGYRQVESWKVSSSLFELKNLILALSIDMLEGFILAFLLKTMTWLLYNWYLASPKVAESETVRTWKKLHCLVRSTSLGVSAPTSKAEWCKCWSKSSKIRKSKRSGLELKSRGLKSRD